MSYTTIYLSHSFFDLKETTLLCGETICVKAFKYESGVEALYIENKLGNCIFLPFQGQQLWRASFCGKDLTMKSCFAEPVYTREFLQNYGALMIHCGATAMGNPSESDIHPLHGELPNAPYQKAYLKVGCDDRGEYVTLGGEYNHVIGLATNYTANPEITLYEDSSVFELDFRITNNRSSAFEYMYMCHLNFLPIDGSRFITTADKNTQHFFKGKFRRLTAEHQKKLDDFTDALIQNPNLGDVLDSQTQYYDPEICSVSTYCSDTEHFGHALQLLPTKDSWYVSFDTTLLPNALRWIARTFDEDASGFALPCSSDHQGFNYAKANNLLLNLDAKATASIKIRFGYLNQEDTEKKIADIKKIIE